MSVLEITNWDCIAISRSTGSCLFCECIVITVRHFYFNRNSNLIWCLMNMPLMQIGSFARECEGCLCALCNNFEFILICLIECCKSLCVILVRDIRQRRLKINKKSEKTLLYYIIFLQKLFTPHLWSATLMWSECIIVISLQQKSLFERRIPLKLIWVPVDGRWLYSSIEL